MSIDMRIIINILIICTSHLSSFGTSTNSLTTNECSANREFPVASSAVVDVPVSGFDSKNDEPPYADSSGNGRGKPLTVGTRDKNDDSVIDSTQPPVLRDKLTDGDNVSPTISSTTHNDQMRATQREGTVELNIIPTESDSALPVLPPLDDAAVGGIEQHQIPTFNEFHAMLSENGDSKANKGAVLPDHERVATSGENKQGPAATHANPSDSPNGFEHGSPIRSQPVTAAETDGARPKSPPSTEKRGGASSRTSSDAIESIDELVTSQTDRPEDATSRPPVPPSSATTFSDNGHVAEHHTPADRPVTLRRNVAAMVCGAKLLDSSQAIKNAEAVLNGNNDEYMNVACSADKWFVIEVCEPVQLRVIELANYELFSSRVKSFKVFVSDRYPAKSWELVGQFLARDVKGLQNFDVTSDKLIKFVKFEMLEHYGSEHYCPLTMIRLFGLVSDDLDDEDNDDDDNVDNEATRTLHNTGGVPKPPPSANTPVVFNPTTTNERESASTTSSGQGSNQLGDPSSKTDNLPPEVHTGSLKSPDLVAPPKSQGVPRPELQPTDSSPGSASKGDSQERTVSGASHNTIPIVDRSSDSVVVPKLSRPTDPSLSAAESNRCQSSTAGQCMVDEVKSDPRDCVGPSHTGVVHSQQSDSHGETQPKSTPDLAGDHAQPLQQVLESGLPPSPQSLSSSKQQPASSSQQSGATISLEASESLSNDQFSGFFKRVKDFFVGWLSSSIYSMLLPELDLIFHSDQGMTLNLSNVRLCPRHVAAIDSLMAYGLLNTSLVSTEQLPRKQHIEFLFPQLSESKRFGLTQLQICLLYLNNLTQSTASFELLSSVNSISSSPRGVTLHFKQHPTLWACYEASKHLDLALHPTPMVPSSTFQYTVPHLFVAFQYRERLRIHARILSFPTERLGGGELVLFRKDPPPRPQTEPWWISPFPDSMCPKLPEFLLSDFTKITATTSNAFEAPQTSNNQATEVDINQKPITPPVSPQLTVNQSPPHSWIRGPRGATREEIVVPAALAGSRKDTLLMRLNNRVRLLERNVSVSMRYLEELSQSYRRQMERLSRSFNLTTAWLKATAQGAEERDQLQQTRIDEIELRLANLVAQLRSGQLHVTHSNDSVESGNATGPEVPSLTAKSNAPKPSFSLDKSPPLPPPPLPPSFDASLEWTPTYGQWPQIEDEWIDEDGVVETEDEDFSRPAYSSWNRAQPDERKSEVKSRNSILSSVSDSSPAIPKTIDPSHESEAYGRRQNLRDVEPVLSQVVADWLWFLYSWLTTQLSYIPWVPTEDWMPHITLPNSNAIWMIYMALLHLILAMCSHLLIYWTWLRPHSRKWQSDLLALPMSTWPPASLAGFEALSLQQQHRSQFSTPPKIQKLPVTEANSEARIPDQSGLYQVTSSSSCNHVDEIEYRMLSSAAPSVKPISDDSQVVSVPSAEWKTSPPLSLYTTPGRPINGLRPPLKFVPASSGRYNTLASVATVTVNTTTTTPIEDKPVIESVTCNQFTNLMPLNSNLATRTDCLQSAKSHDSCNGHCKVLPQHIVSRPVSDQPKLSKNAIRRRNRREKAKRNEQPRSCQPQ